MTSFNLNNYQRTQPGPNPPWPCGVRLQTCPSAAVQGVGCGLALHPTPAGTPPDQWRPGCDHTCPAQSCRHDIQLQVRNVVDHSTQHSPAGTTCSHACPAQSYARTACRFKYTASDTAQTRQATPTAMAGLTRLAATVFTIDAASPTTCTSQNSNASCQHPAQHPARCKFMLSATAAAHLL